MTIDLTDTTTSAIREALSRERKRLGGGTTGMVLNLIIVTDEAGQYDAMRAANEAGRQHPCRILGVIIRRPAAPSRLDAEIHSRRGRTQPDRAAADVRRRSASTPTRWSGRCSRRTPRCWCGGRARARPTPSADPLGVLAQRRVTDSAESPSPRDALTVLARGYQQGDTDLAWTRATSWRSLLAATLDQPHGTITGGHVAAEKGNPTADLIAAWLSCRLGVPFSRDESGGPGVTEVRFATSEGDIVLARGDGRLATLSKPGQPDRRVALHRREAPELLAEELRRLNPDEVYGETLAELAAGAGALAANGADAGAAS